MSLLNSFVKIGGVISPYKLCLNRLSLSAVQSKLSVEEKLGIKPKPKRPASTFLRFVAKIKPDLLTVKPSASVTEINKLASEKWKVLDNKEKEKLHKEYKEDWDKYLVDMRNYDRTLSPGDREQISKYVIEEKEVKMKRAMKKKLKDLGKPKRPPSVFVLFMKSKLHERGSQSYKDWQQALKKEWGSLSPSIKESYENDYKKLLENFKKELTKWEKKMETEGHKELVRTRSSRS